ncbi:MAG: hypothetical protein HRF48_06825 [Chloroflexota bacterium]
MIAYWIKRCALTFILALPAWLGLNVLCYLVFCILTGPWGAALEDAEAQNAPSYSLPLAWALRVMLFVGALLIGWRWSEKFLPRGEPSKPLARR